MCVDYFNWKQCDKKICCVKSDRNICCIKSDVKISSVESDVTISCVKSDNKNYWITREKQISCIKIDMGKIVSKLMQNITMLHKNNLHLKWITNILQHESPKKIITTVKILNLVSSSQTVGRNKLECLSA